MSQNRLKKFTHSKIAEQLAKRKDIPNYEAVLLKCKVSEDSVGIVLDTSSPAWKQLQVMVYNHEQSLKNDTILPGNGDNDADYTLQLPSNGTGAQSASIERSLSQNNQQQTNNQNPQSPSEQLILAKNNSTGTKLTSTSSYHQQQQPERPQTPPKLDRTASTRSNTQQQYSTKPRQTFKPLVFPRCPSDSVRALCCELFVLKPGFEGSIFRDNFQPEKIASQTDPISPFYGIPDHLLLSPQISVSAVRKACLHNGIACIPNCLRGMVWAILLDIDMSILTGMCPSTDPNATPQSPPVTPTTPLRSPTLTQNRTFTTPMPSGNNSTSLHRTASSHHNNDGIKAQEFITKHAVTPEPEDPSLPPVSGLSVIKVDLNRTYPHLDIFSLQSTQQVMEKLLVKSCRVSDLEYKQGMNYLLATLMLVWMPVFSKYSTEDFIQPQPNNTNNNNSTPTSTLNPNQLNPQYSATGAAAAFVNGNTAMAMQGQGFPTSPSSLSNISTSSNSSNTNLNNNIQQSKELSSAQAAAIHEKHFQYQLQLEGEHYQQVKYPQTADILYKNSSLITACLTQLIAKLLPNTYSDRDFGSLQCLFMFFRLLLQYHDPILSYHLDYHETSPEFYAAPWFLTLHVTRTKDVSIILLLWDHLLLYLRQDPMLHYFISLGLLIDKREVLLQQQDTTLPEMLSKMCITSPQHLYTLFLFACQLRAQTPPSASRLLHQISTSTIGADGDEITQLTNMLALEVGADESLNQTLGTNRYTYKDMLSSFHNSYYTNLLNKDLTAVLPNQSGNAQLQSLILSTSGQNTSATPFLFIDCRDTWSFRRGHLSAAINFPLQHLADMEQRDQLLKTIAGFKSMHVCIIHDGLLQPGIDGNGQITPSQWAQHMNGHQGANNQIKTLTALISFLIYEGIRYVSVVSRGWIDIHSTALVLGVELVNHSPSQCPICQNPHRYEQYLNEATASLPSSSSSLTANSLNNRGGNNNNNASMNTKFNTGLFSSNNQRNQKNAFLEGNEIAHSPSSFSPGSFVDNANAPLRKSGNSSQQGLFSSISRFFNYNNQQGQQSQQPNTNYSNHSHDTIQSASQPTFSSSPLRNNNNDGDVFTSNDGSNNNNNNNQQQSLIVAENHFDVSPSSNSSNHNNPSPISQNLDSFIGGNNNSSNEQPNRPSMGFGGINSQQSQQLALTKLKPLQSQPILTPPSLLHAMMISNLRNVANMGSSVRQSLSYCLQQLLTTALDNVDPPFIPNSGYALTGLEYNYQEGCNNNNNSSNSTTSDLWIQGRIKTTSISSPAAGCSNPQPPPSYIGYLLQSQLSLIGIVRPLTFLTNDNINNILPLTSSSSSSSSSSIPEQSQHDPNDPQLFFSHDVMSHMLSSAAKRFDEMFLISTGCIEVTPSTPMEDFFASSSSTTLTTPTTQTDGTTTPRNSMPLQQQQSREVEWLPRPLSLPSGMASQHVVLFIPILTFHTAAWVLATLTFLIEHRNIPSQQIALICITTTREGFDIVQHGYQQIYTRVMNKQQAASDQQASTTTTTPKTTIKPLVIVSASLSQQEPLNKQPVFVQTEASQRAMYHKDDEHCDIYPSIPQLFARYLQKAE